MKKRLLSSLLMLLIFLVPTSSVEAKVIADEDFVVVEADEVIEDDLFISGGSVKILGAVDGDVFAAGGTLDLSGEIRGDLVVAGGTISISGLIEDDLWGAGGTIRIEKATIGDSVLLAGGQVDLDETVTVGGSLLVAGGTINNLAPVARSFFAGGGMVRLNAPVEGEVRLAGEQLSIGEATTIGGDLVYEATEMDNQAATVSGQVRKLEIKDEWTKAAPEARQAMKEAWAGTKSVFRFWQLLSALVVGLVFVALFPKPAAKIGSLLTQKPFEAMLAGLLTIVAGAAAVVLVMITVIGVPLAMITASLMGVYLYLVKIFVGLAVGEWLKEIFKTKKMSLYASSSLGLLTYFVVSAIPFVGFLARLLGGLMGLGTGYRYLKEAKSKKSK